MKGKTRYPQDMQMRKAEAMVYLNCGSTTFSNYVKAGHITHVGVSTTDPRTKFYLVRDLDLMRPLLGTRAGKRQTGKVAASIQVIADSLPDLPEDQQTPIGEIDTTQARLMEAVGIPSSVSLHKGQDILRKHILVRAVQTKVVDTLFQGLDNPDARIQQTAVKNILSLILPQLKTVESIKIDNPDDVNRQNALSEDINKLHERIKNMKLNAPTITMQGVRIIDID